LQGQALALRFVGMFHPIWFLPLAFSLPLSAREEAPLPPALSAYVLEAAPQSTAPLLRKGDRLAICGDSITEQKRYSLILETYLTACRPELEITCRQYGWSGEQIGGFLKRIESDVLRFEPTVATTCYGMNDFRYQPYQKEIADEFRKNQTAMVGAFQAIGCRVVLGSPGIIDSVPHWVKTASGTQEQLNLTLSRFRNIAVEVARETNSGFADIYQPMLLADHEAKKRYGADFKVAGKDGVHPDWAGHLVMAYGFLKGLGLDGDMGSITYHEATGVATAASGHEVLACADGKFTLLSRRLPFSPGPGAGDRDDSLRAGLGLVPFDDELNRFIFRIESPKSASYTIQWGKQKREYTSAELARGVNLAKDFDNHPLVPAFAKIWEAVGKKQEYETRQIKMLVHGPEGAADREATFALTEKTRATFEKAVFAARQPVQHQIRISAGK
jgi:lysophospholipase L1-like esterase